MRFCTADETIKKPEPFQLDSAPDPGHKTSAGQDAPSSYVRRRRVIKSCKKPQIISILFMYSAISQFIRLFYFMDGFF